MDSLIAITLVLFASAAHARDREETCTSYQRATGTVVSDCRSPGRRERQCESTTHATGTATTECRE